MTITKKYGTLSRLVLGTDVFVVLTKPEDYKLVLTNVNGNNKTSVTKQWYPLLGNGIIRASGTTHRLRRKIIQPFLNIKYLTDYVTFFDNYSHNCADLLEKEIGGHIFDIKPYMAQYAADIFLASIAGIQGTAHKGEYNEILYWQDRLIKCVWKTIIKPWQQIEWIFCLSDNKKKMCTAQKTVQDFIYNIAMQKKTMECNGLNYDSEYFEKSVIGNYSSHMKQLFDDETNKSCAVSDEDFIDDVRSLYIAIQNTIMEMTSMTLLMLGMHVEIQEKLRKEILTIFGNDNLDVKRLMTIRYLHMVIQETLRLFPASPIISRQLTGDIQLESCVLPDGCLVMIPIFAIHRNPMYWDKPEEFIPERFSSENSSTRHRYTYIPFGTGPRDCLGQRYTFLSVGAAIVNLLRRFRFVATGSVKDVKLTNDILLRSRDGIKLSVFRLEDH
ncbi:cytochrome P450 4C1-like [Linepithema humile]|uniref:cytochrome P450 4C1-like n=1 Tax=Linepithema humile TaxID=83485 RepID=UPI00351EA637